MQVLKLKAGFLRGAGIGSFLVVLAYVYLIFAECIGNNIKMTAMIVGAVFFMLFGILFLNESFKLSDYIKEEEKRRKEELKQSFRRAREQAKIENGKKGDSR